MIIKEKFFILVLCCVVIITVNGENELRRSIVANENPFRTAKMNFIWSKAVHHLSDKSVLKSVKKELERFDGIYLSAKERSLKSGRNDLHEVDRKLEQTMKKYDLDGAVTAYNKKVKWRNQEDQKRKNTVIGSEKFTDTKLNKLWQAALSKQFSGYQLKNIRRELKGYQKKEDDYHKMLQEYRETRHENFLDGYDENNRDELNRQLKNMSRELTKEYDRLHETILGNLSTTFRNEEVDALWRVAVLDSDYNESELEFIRAELAYFDKRMNKLLLHEEELEAMKENHVSKKDVLAENFNEFEADLLRLKRKLKKLGKKLEGRIRHSEL